MGGFSDKSNKGLLKFWNIITFGIFSRFSHHEELDGLDDFSGEEAFDNDAQKANYLCEELMDSSKKKIDLLKEIQALSKKEKELGKFQLLTVQDLKRVRQLLFDHKAIIEEKEALKGRLISKNRILNKIQSHEEDIPKILQEIKDAEEKQRRVKRDVDYLEGEKEALIYSREQLENAQILIRRFSIGAVIVLGVIALIFSVIIIHRDARILIPGSITMFLAIGIGTWLYIFQRQVEHEILKNGRMQVRAVKLLNKAKIRYVYYTNFLEYEFKKFYVDSLEQLERSWELYKKNKHHEKRYRNINSTMTRIEDQVLDILNNRGIKIDFFDDIRQWSEIEERKKVLQNIQKEKSTLEDKLDFMDTYQEEIWNQLTKLREQDQTEDKIIEKIIKNYLEDLGPQRH